MKRAFAALFGLLAFGAAPPPEPVALATLLAETPAPSLDAYRLFTDDRARRPNAGLTPYALNTPLFSGLCGEDPLPLPAAGRQGALSGDRHAGPAGRRDPGEDLRLSGRLPPAERQCAVPGDPAADPPQGGLGRADLCLERRADARGAEAGGRADRRQLRRCPRRDPPGRLRRPQCQPVQGMPLAFQGDRAHRGEGAQPERRLPLCDRAGEPAGALDAHRPAGGRAGARKGPGDRSRGTMPPNRWRPAPGPISTAIAPTVTTPAAWPATPACSSIWRKPTPRSSASASGRWAAGRGSGNLEFAIAPGPAGRLDHRPPHGLDRALG